MSPYPLHEAKHRSDFRTFDVVFRVRPASEQLADLGHRSSCTW